MVPQDYKLPPVAPRELLPADTYAVEILDIDKVENKFYDPSDSASSDHQIQFSLGVVETGPYLGKTFQVWASPKISAGTKQSKLYQIFCAALGSPLTKEQVANARELVSPDFFNSIIGAQMRVLVEKKMNKTGDAECNAVTAFLAKKADYPTFVKKV